jgi:tetratricopeptide (TPR) repeat protein
MAIKKNKKFLDAYNNRATDYERLKQYDKAINDYSKIVRLNPSDDIAYYNRGLLYVQLNQKEEAAEDFEEAIRLDGIWEKELRGKIDELKK